MRWTGRRTAALALSGAFAVAAAARAQSPSTATADFSGGGAQETITAQAKGKTVRLEVHDKSGKRLARAEAPAPEGRTPQVALSTGSIGSVGTLLEVAASDEEAVCRSVWRFRDGALSRLPVLDRGKPIPDCAGASDWKSAWDETHNEPARYVRERTRETPQGRLHETQVFVFAGFELQQDTKRSSAEINGVPIPEWYDAELYVKSELDALFQRFSLSGLHKAPRMHLEADRDRGVFAVHLSDRNGELSLPVTASKPVGGDDPGVELEAGEPTVRVKVSLARGSIPTDAIVKGTGPRFDSAYAPIIHWGSARIRVYPNAEQELASEVLPGTWATERNESVTIASSPGPGVIRYGDVDASVQLDGVPQGADLLVVPRDGKPPLWALALTGPNGLVRIPVRCGETGAERPCRATGEGQSLKRVGSILNVR